MGLPEGGEEAANKVASAVRGAIAAKHPDAQFAVDTVSGKVSNELYKWGAISITLAMLGIAIYIWFRFEWQFGVGALTTLFHDVAMTMGFFSLTQLEFNLNIVAAFLTIVGYSLNDTVVIYDRIRENLRKYRKMQIVHLLNVSLNETLSRTMVTSLSIMLALAVLLVLGPKVIFGLTIAILLGTFIGTYSSIYISAPVLVWLKVDSNSFLPRTTGGSAERVPSRNESFS
jgi:preprotein translocase subunit SecF